MTTGIAGFAAAWIASVGWAGQWIVIADGSTTPDGAEAKLAATYPGADLQAAEGFPRVVDSASVRGLKAGFHVVVLAACDEARAASLLLDQVRLSVPGAYVREVSWPLPLGCPVEIAAIAPAATYTALETAPLVEGSDLWRWDLFTHPDAATGRDVLDVRLVHRDGAVVHRRTIRPRWRCGRRPGRRSARARRVRGLPARLDPRSGRPKAPRRAAHRRSGRR